MGVVPLTSILSHKGGGGHYHLSVALRRSMITRDYEKGFPGGFSVISEDSPTNLMAVVPPIGVKLTLVSNPLSR